MRKAAAAAAMSVLVGASLVAACGGSTSHSSSPSASTSTPTVKTVVSAACSGTPVEGGALTYARQTGPLSLNPFETVNGNGDIFAATLIYQGLVMPDPTGKTQNVEPAVASSWDVTGGGKVYTFHIRPGIRFSNGQPVTAADVKYSLDTFVNPKLDETAQLATGYKSTTIVNSSTVRMNLTAPTPGILYNMSIFDAFIVPMKLVKQEGAKFYNNPVGTGPFKMTKWARGSSITFTKNPYYWQPGLPYLNQVTYDYAENDNTRVLDLESHEAQIADGIPFSQVSTLEKRSGLSVQTAKVPYWVGLWLNQKEAPFKNLDVRQAMEYALDRNAINKEIFDGLGTIPNSVLPQLKYDAPDSAVPPYTYDLAKAKKLMSESPFPHGFSVTLQYPEGYAEYTDLALVMESEYAAIGIKLTLRSVDQATETKDWSGGQYDMIFPFAEFTSDVTVPDEYATFVGVYDGDDGFYTYWNDPQISKMIVAFTHTESEAVRAQEWPRIQAAMLQQTPAINVMDLPFINAHQASVCGTDLDPLGADSLQYTWIAK
jgi:peptide/nickel transport system substrate-binding protein